MVHGGFVQIGASLMTNANDYRFNDALLPSSASSTPKDAIPAGATIVLARLYWGGSATAAGPDQAAQFTLADGFAADVVAKTCKTVTISSAVGDMPHFLCQADVTALVAGHLGVSNGNGKYAVGGVDAKPAVTTTSGCSAKYNGSPETLCCAPSNLLCQASHASWSLLIVYDAPAQVAAVSDVYLIDGFVALDESAVATSQLYVNLAGLAPAGKGTAKVALYGLEGDLQLGNPQQDPPGSDDSPPCATCFDFASANGVKLTAGAANPYPNNLLNASSGAGTDLDVFDISAMLPAAKKTLDIVVSSGNGSLADNDNSTNLGGDGELFFLAYVIVQVPRFVP